jgi:glutathione S-transferase
MGDRLTGADFMLSFPLYLAWIENWFDGLPKIKAYVERLLARPAFANAIADTAMVVEQFEALKRQRVG